MALSLADRAKYIEARRRRSLLNLNPFYGHVCIDGNVINGYFNGDTDCKEIMALMFHDEISFVIPYSVKMEIEHKSTPQDVRMFISEFLFTHPDAVSATDIDAFFQFLEHAKGKSKVKNVKSDLLHVYESQKYGARHFVTFDKRLLGRSIDTYNYFRTIHVVCPKDFMSKVRYHISPSPNPLP